MAGAATLGPSNLFLATPHGAGQRKEAGRGEGSELVEGKVRGQVEGTRAGLAGGGSLEIEKETGQWDS